MLYPLSVFSPGRSVDVDPADGDGLVLQVGAAGEALPAVGPADGLLQVPPVAAQRRHGVQRAGAAVTRERRVETQLVVAGDHDLVAVRQAGCEKRGELTVCTVHHHQRLVVSW